MKRQDERALRSFPGAFPVSPFPPSARNGALRTPAISGRKCAELSGNCVPIGCLAKMLLTSSIWDSTKRSLTWERRDTLLGHSLFLLVPSARGMNGSELLLWGLMFPTPLAADTGTRPQHPRIVVSPTGTYRKAKRSGHWTPCLSEVVYHLEKDADESLRINPEWVEWLMGFPPGWTEAPSGSQSR